MENRAFALVVVCVLAAPGIAMANSVDCQKKPSKIDQIVCSSPDLLRLDEKFAESYKIARGLSVDPAAFRDQVRRDLEWRQKNCQDAACLDEWYGYTIPRYDAMANNSILERRQRGGGAAVGRNQTATPFTPEIRGLTQKYARASGQCEIHASSSEVGRAACPKSKEYANALAAAGWDPQSARKQLFDGCSRFGSAYQLAAIARDNRQAPETALRSLQAEKWLRIDEPGLKSIINTAYFQDWAIRLAPLALAHGVETECRYGPDQSWQPLK